MIALTCETDFVARNENSAKWLRILLCMSPLPIGIFACKRRTTSLDRTRKDIYREQLRAQGKPEEMMDKIMEKCWKSSMQNAFC